jgi:hypothetical protein
VRPLRLARSFLPERPSDNDGKPGGYSRQPRIGGNPRSGRRPGKRGPAQAFRLRLWAKRKKTAANEPGHFKDVRVARREALPHFRKEMRILNRRRQRPLARHPLASGGEKEDRPARDTGDGAWAWRVVFVALLNQRQARTGNTCNSLATALEHLSHTLRWHQRRRDSAIPFNDIGAR